MITVMKFGGTSVGSAEAIQRVANIIVNTQGDKVVVASAMSGITNFLVQVVDSPTMDVDEVVKQFADKHLMAAEQMFDEKSSTDDHGMHLYGCAKDQNGTKYYLIKNSWGVTGAYDGVWYMSENFVKAKTLNFVVNKKALPKDIQKKLGIK